MLLCSLLSHVVMCPFVSETWYKHTMHCILPIYNSQNSRSSGHLEGVLNFRLWWQFELRHSTDTLVDVYASLCENCKWFLSCAIRSIYFYFSFAAQNTQNVIFMFDSIMYFSCKWDPFRILDSSLDKFLS